MLNVDAVHAMKSIPRVVECLPKLPASSDGLDFECERIEARVGANLHGRSLGMLGRGNSAHAREPAGEINPTVRPKGWMTDAQLG